MSFRLVTQQDTKFDEPSRNLESELYREVSAIVGDTKHVSLDGNDAVNICLTSGEYDDRDVNVIITRTTGETGKWDVKITNLDESGRDHFATGLSDNDLLLAVVVAHITLTEEFDEFPWGVNPILGMEEATLLEGSADIKDGEVVSASGSILSYYLEEVIERFYGRSDPDEPRTPCDPVVVDASWELSDGVWSGKKVYFSVIEDIDEIGGVVKVYELRKSKLPWWKRWSGIGILECADEVTSDHNITDEEYREAGAVRMKVKRDVKRFKNLTTAEFVKEFGDL